MLVYSLMDVQFNRKKEIFAERTRELSAGFYADSSHPTPPVHLVVDVDIPVREHFGTKRGLEFLKVEPLDELLKNSGLEDLQHFPSSVGHNICVLAKSRRACVEGNYRFDLHADTHRVSIDKTLPFKLSIERHLNGARETLNPVLPLIEEVVRYVENRQNYS